MNLMLILCKFKITKLLTHRERFYKILLSYLFFDVFLSFKTRGKSAEFYLSVL
ncbi:hypothetical protein PBAC_26490 [Pedobacter glucosidilyticus]|nr:hypothetical protein PBAC_26490 [Pedobacter glucosidilyticus]